MAALTVDGALLLFELPLERLEDRPFGLEIVRPPERPALGDDPIGVLVLDGLLSRTLSFDGLHSPTMVAHLACMRRPTVSATIMRLARAGELRRYADETWLFTGFPPHLSSIARREAARRLSRRPGTAASPALFARHDEWQQRPGA